jgi:hypothetical protein
MISVMKLRVVIWAGHAECKGEERNSLRVLVGKCEGKTPLGRDRHRRDDNIEIDFKGLG